MQENKKTNKITKKKKIKQKTSTDMEAFVFDYNKHSFIFHTSCIQRLPSISLERLEVD